MKVLGTLFILLLLIPPAFGEVKKGKILFNEPQLKNEVPKLDRDAWEDYKDVLASEIVRRTKAKLKMLNMPSQGSINVTLKISNRGDIEENVLSDRSTNLEFICTNVISDMEHSEFLQFPAGSTEVYCTVNIKISTLDDFLLTYKFR